MSINILKEFKETFISFIDELIEQFPNEGDLVLLRIYLKDQAIIKEVMDTFVLNLAKDNELLKKMVKERNENFFLDYNFLQNKNTDKENHFKKLWRSDNLDNDDKKVIWKWVDALVFISEKYVKSI
jgi:hypothetical protein